MLYKLYTVYTSIKWRSTNTWQGKRRLGWGNISCGTTYPYLYMVKHTIYKSEVDNSLRGLSQRTIMNKSLKIYQVQGVDTYRYTYKHLFSSLKYIYTSKQIKAEPTGWSVRDWNLALHTADSNNVTTILRLEDRQGRWKYINRK